ncbi:MAG: glycosyltransferase family 4 protein [Thermomicrobiales bacterium]
MMGRETGDNAQVQAGQGTVQRSRTLVAESAGTGVLRPSSFVLPRVACFTPLSPIASGISYYSEELLPVLALALALDVYVDGYAPSERAPLEAAGVRLRQAREFDHAAARAPYEATIYQFGNSPAHAYMYDRALRAPGIVVLHDVVLHHLRLWMAVNHGRRREYMADLARLYGAAGSEVARAVLRGQTPPALFDYPLVEPVLDAAKVVIVHNAASAERVRALRPSADVRVVPMGVPLPLPAPRDEARARLGVAPDAFLVVSHGHVTPYKRLDVVLRAFRRLVTERPGARFLIAGSEAPGLGELLERQIGYLGLGGKATRLGFIPPATVADLLAAADCCVNLRYPSAGETSASLLRIMGAGLPVIVSDAGSFRELPDACVIKVPVGRLEEPLLAEYLLELARDDDLRSALGANARDFVATAHSLERSAEGYLAALGAVLGRTLTLPPVVASTPLAVSVATTAPPMRHRSCLPWRPRFGNRNRQRVAAVASPDAADSLLDGIAGALAELRLAGHEPTERAVARDIVALGLGASGTQEKGDG